MHHRLELVFFLLEKKKKKIRAHHSLQNEFSLSITLPQISFSRLTSHHIQWDTHNPVFYKLNNFTALLFISHIYLSLICPFKISTYFFSSNLRCVGPISQLVFCLHLYIILLCVTCNRWHTELYTPAGQRTSLSLLKESLIFSFSQQSLI